MNCRAKWPSLCWLQSHLSKFDVTDRSKAIRLWWFFLFYVLVFEIFCAVGALYVFIFLIKVTEWPPIGKIAAHSAYDMFHGISA